MANYLKAQGVSYGQIRSIQGVGSSQPVPGHENNVKDAANRRVEVYLYASEAMIKKAEAGTLNYSASSRLGPQRPWASAKGLRTEKKASHPIAAQRSGGRVAF